MVLVVIGLAAVGFAIGVCAGLLGIGGGMIMVPVLSLAFGLDAHAATATSLFAILFTSASGAGARLRNKTCIPKLSVALGLGGCITSVLGVYLGSISPTWAIMLVAAVIIIYSCVNMVKKALAMPRGETEETAARQSAAGQGQAVSPQPTVQDAAFDATPKKLAIGFLIGMAAGLASGYVGVGGGFIMVPLMTGILGVSMRHATGTSLIAIIILAIPGVASQAFYGNIDYLMGVCLALGSIPGAIVGGRLVTRVPERQLRLFFAAFLAVAAVMIVVRELGAF